MQGSRFLLTIAAIGVSASSAGAQTELFFEGFESYTACTQCGGLDLTQNPSVTLPTVGGDWVAQSTWEVLAPRAQDYTDPWDDPAGDPFGGPTRADFNGDLVIDSNDAWGGTIVSETQFPGTPTSAGGTPVFDGQNMGRLWQRYQAANDPVNMPEQVYNRFNTDPSKGTSKVRIEWYVTTAWTGSDGRGWTKVSLTGTGDETDERLSLVLDQTTSAKSVVEIAGAGIAPGASGSSYNYPGVTSSPLVEQYDSSFAIPDLWTYFMMEVDLTGGTQATAKVYSKIVASGDTSPMTETDRVSFSGLGDSITFDWSGDGATYVDAIAISTREGNSNSWYDNIRVTDLSPPALAGDLNDDGFVGVDDLNIVLVNWNQNVTPGDKSMGDPTGEGFVGVDDLNIVLVNWNNGTPPVVAVPEPASLCLLGLGGLAVLRRRH